MTNVSFQNLPLELKSLVIEHDLSILKSLIQVDQDILDYINSEEGKNWLRRIGSVKIDTDEEQGILIAGFIKDGQWNYYDYYDSIYSDKFTTYAESLDEDEGIDEEGTPIIIIPEHIPRHIPFVMEDARDLFRSEKYDMGNLYEVIDYIAKIPEQIIDKITSITNGGRCVTITGYDVGPNIVQDVSVFLDGELKDLKIYKPLESDEETTYLSEWTQYIDDVNYITFIYNEDGTRSEMLSNGSDTAGYKNNKIFYLSGNIGIMFHSENYEDSSKNIYYDNSTHQLKKYILFARHPDEKIWVDYVETKYDLDGAIVRKKYVKNNEVIVQENYVNGIYNNTIDNR